MHKVQKKLDLNNLLIKLQKPIVLFMFFAIIAVFVYSLIYMTPFFGLYKADTTLLNKYLTQYGLEYGMFDEASHVLRNDRVIGIDVKYFTLFVREAGYMQDFNKWMFKISFVGILVTCLLFVYFSQKRKRYYVTNLVSFGIVAGFDFYVGFKTITYISGWKKYVAGLNYTIINAYQSSMNLDTELVEYYSPQTFSWIFTLGYIVGAILIIAAVLGIALVLCKFFYQLKHKAIDTSEVKINE
jgi:hypothetical protein